MKFTKHGDTYSITEITEASVASLLYACEVGRNRDPSTHPRLSEFFNGLFKVAYGIKLTRSPKELRIEELLKKANHGQLTEDEKTELKSLIAAVKV